jgi:predicted dehydrogenase
MSNTKKIWAVVVGCGNRGSIYADYSLIHGDEFGIAAVVDPNPFKLHEFQKLYNLANDRLFSSFDDFLKSNVYCDFVINTTMDQYHYETAMQIINAKYNMLIEKPIVPNKEQLLEIKRAAEANNVRVFVCHVLRYSPFYKKIKEVILSGAIGEIVTMEMNEHVGLSHYLVSYTRGKWNSESACGSSFLLAKCCHDLDLICWLNNSTIPTHVTGFGARAQYIPEKAPADSAEYCYQCKYRESCIYDADKEYVQRGAMPFLVWDKLNKPLDEITTEEKREHLKTDIYGKCAYKCGGDITDRQNVLVQFENKSMAAFTLVSGAMKGGRDINIVGTLGEIQGNLEDNKIVLRIFNKQTRWGERHEIKIEHAANTAKGGHSGGDVGLMHDLLAYLNGEGTSVSLTTLNDSIYGHLCVYAAEEARKTLTVVPLPKL